VPEKKILNKKVKRAWLLKRVLLEQVQQKSSIANLNQLAALRLITKLGEYEL